MATDQAKKKNGLGGRLIVLLVIVVLGLMVFQMSMDALEMAESAQIPTHQYENVPTSEPTDAGPTPTIDFSEPVQETT